MWARCGLGSKYVLYLHTAKTLKTYVCTISISTFLLPHFLSDIYTGLVELGGGKINLQRLMNRYRIQYTL